MQGNIGKKSLPISIMIFISRILGYIRDILLANLLGTGPLNDTFIAAFKFTNMFRSIFAEGAFTSAFVPVFSRILQQNSLAYAKKLASRVQFWLILCLLIFVAIFAYFLPNVMAYTTPGFIKNKIILADGQNLLDTAVSLARIMLPYLIMISLAAFYGSMLNSLGHFIPFMLTSCILNLSIISGALMAPFAWTRTAAHFIAYTITFSGFLELTWMMYQAKRHNIFINFHLSRVINFIQRPSLRRLTSGGEMLQHLKKILHNMGASVLSSMLNQCNNLISMFVLSQVPGGLSYLYFADRLVQLPLALFSTALAPVMLPLTAHQHANKEEAHEKLCATLGQAIELSMFFIIPAAMGIFFMAEDIITLLFRHGSFDSKSVAGTLSVLRILALGLPGFAIIKLMTTMLYGLGEARAQLRLGLLSITVNILLGWGLFRYFQHLSIIISAIVATYLNTLQILWIIYQKFGLYLKKNYLQSIGKIFLATLLMCLTVQLLQLYVNSENILEQSYAYFCGFVVSKIIGAVIIYASLCITFKIKLAEDIRNYLRRAIKTGINRYKS